MFRRTDRRQTEDRQKTDNTTNDEVIEAKIKECQRENGRLMVCTANNLRNQFDYDDVDRIIRRLNKRRARGNKYQQNESSKIMDTILQLAKASDSMTTQSSNFMSV